MPNGRTRGIRLASSHLEKLLTGLEGKSIVGETFGGDNPVTAGQLESALKASAEHPIYVEEQDHSWFIIQLPRDNHSEWVCVNQRSVLYTGLLRAFSPS